MWQKHCQRAAVNVSNTMYNIVERNMHMRRTMKKTVAATLAVATLISTIVAGSMGMAGMAATAQNNEPEAKVEVVMEDGATTMMLEGGFGWSASNGHWSGASRDGYYYPAVTEINDFFAEADTKLILIDKKGNISEIYNKNDDGSTKFNKLLSSYSISGSNYWLQLCKDEKLTAVDMEGNYLGGSLTYYEIDAVLRYDSGNGITVSEKTDNNGNTFYDCQLVLESGKVIHLDDAANKDECNYRLTKAENVIYVCNYNGIHYLCDSQGNEININEDISDIYSLGDKVIINCLLDNIAYICDKNGKIESILEYTEFIGITGNYICIRVNDEVKVYNAELKEVMRLNEPDAYINIGALSESGYLIVNRWGTGNWSDDIVSLDGVYWRGSDDLGTVKVLNAEKGYYVGTGNIGRHILSKDKTIDVDIDEKIKEVLENEGYKTNVVTSSYYTLNGNVHVRWIEVEDEEYAADIYGKEYVFREEDGFANPVDINEIGEQIGDTYVKKTEDGTCNIYNNNNELVYTSSEDTIKYIYTTEYENYNLLLIVNKDDAFSIIDWNGKVQYQSKDDTFWYKMVDGSGNLLIESKINDETGRYKLLRAYTLFNNDNDDTDNNLQESDEPYIYVLPADNPVITAEEFEKLLEINKYRDVIIDNGSGVTFTFEKGTMERVAGKTEYDFGVIIITEYEKIDVTVPYWVEQNNFAALIHYRYSGKLPAKCAIRFNIGEEWAGKTLYYSYLKDGEVSETKEIEVDSRGYVTVIQTHCSDYIITADNPMEKINEVPNTGENINKGICVGLIMSMIGMLIFAAYRRKNNA